MNTYFLINNISFYRSRKSPTFVTDKSPTFVTDIYEQEWAYKLHYKSSNSLVFRGFAFRHITDICYRQVSDIYTDKSPTFAPTFTPTFCDNFFYQFALSFGIKIKKNSNFTAGGLTTKIFYDGISDILKISVIPHKP